MKKLLPELPKIIVGAIFLWLVNYSIWYCAGYSLNTPLDFTAGDFINICVLYYLVNVIIDFLKDKQTAKPYDHSPLH